jgi:quinoprotein glucose dehydrogenase
MLRYALLLSAIATAQSQSPDTSDWGYYGGDIFGQRYSSLAEISRSNVAKLTVAWQFRTGELGEGLARADRLAFEATPVLAFGMLYLSTPADVVIALDPATGAQRWRYDPRIDRKRPYAEVTSRGVSVWEDSNSTRPALCGRRVFIGTLDARLIALDAGTGKPCVDFGSLGAIDLTAGVAIHAPNDYVFTSPPAVFGGLVIVGSAIQGGSVRAFDARTGALRWSSNAARAWAVMSVDPDRGLLLAPSGSALLALDAATGKSIWRQELVHHDLWGYELAAQPTLIDLELRGAPIPAVLQATMSGMLFVFERDTGKPLFPVVEQRVPRSRSGVQTAATQPFPVTPSLVSQSPLDPADAWGVTFWDRRQCRKIIESHRNEGIFTPPDRRGTIQNPGDIGGVNWGGIAFDARSQRIFAAVNHLPMLVSPDGRHREPLQSSWGLPCTAPPWGTLVSVDLRENQIVWQVPLGSTEGIGPWFAPTRNFGTPNMGGPIATAGDLVFIGAAMDGYFRAFDLETGRELWKHRLPAGGQATPMTYRAGPKHRQFIVIAAGGHGGLGTRRGDYVVAFALPGDEK